VQSWACNLPWYCLGGRRGSRAAADAAATAVAAAASPRCVIFGKGSGCSDDIGVDGRRGDGRRAAAAAAASAAAVDGGSCMAAHRSSSCCGLLRRCRRFGVDGGGGGIAADGGMDSRSSCSCGRRFTSPLSLRLRRIRLAAAAAAAAATAAAPMGVVFGVKTRFTQSGRCNLSSGVKTRIIQSFRCNLSCIPCRFVVFFGRRFTFPSGRGRPAIGVSPGFDTCHQFPAVTICQDFVYRYAGTHSQTMSLCTLSLKKLMLFCAVGN